MIEGIGFNRMGEIQKKMRQMTVMWRSFSANSFSGGQVFLRNWFRFQLELKLISTHQENISWIV